MLVAFSNRGSHFDDLKPGIEGLPLVENRQEEVGGTRLVQLVFNTALSEEGPFDGADAHLGGAGGMNRLQRENHYNGGDQPPLDPVEQDFSIHIGNLRNAQWEVESMTGMVKLVEPIEKSRMRLWTSSGLKAFAPPAGTRMVSRLVRLAAIFIPTSMSEPAPR